MEQILRNSLKTIKPRSNIIYFEVLAYYLIILIIITGIKYVLTMEINFLVISYFLFSIIIIGWCQFSLSNALHEALHKNFGKKHNEFLSAILTAYPIGFTFAYRKTHMDHHKYFGNPELDPDFDSYSPFPKSKVDMLKRIIYNISGIAAIKQFFFENRKNRKKDAGKSDFIALTITQFFILTIFVLVFNEPFLISGVIAYIFFWLFPLVSIAKLFSSTRLLCEHGSPNNRLTFRTITGNIFQTNTLGAFKFNYHAEHHIEPYIPYSSLKQAKEIIKGSIRNKEVEYEEYQKGYFWLLYSWFKMLPLKTKIKSGS